LNGQFYVQKVVNLKQTSHSFYYQFLSIITHSIQVK